MSGNIIQLNEELLKNDLKNLVRRTVGDTLKELLDHEADKLVNAEKIRAFRTPPGISLWAL